MYRDTVFASTSGRSRHNLLRLVLLSVFALCAFGFGGCLTAEQRAALPPDVPIAVDVPIEDLMLTQDDLPGILDWPAPIYPRSPIDWGATGAFESRFQHFQSLDPRGQVSQSVVFYSNARKAAETWFMQEDMQILDEFVVESHPEVVTVQSLPPLHADQTHVVCDEYGLRYPRCIVRLRYGPVFTEVSMEMTGTVTPEVFGALVGAIDQRMAPVWQ